MEAIREKYTYWVEDQSYDDDGQWKISFVPFRRDMENKTTLRLFPEHIRLETHMEAVHIIERVEQQDK